MRNLASHIDHTLLSPTADRAAIEKLCEEAATRRFAAVCVNPYWAPTAAAASRDVDVKVCCVVGFPLGATPAEMKRAETEWCLDHGAGEIDAVMNIGAAKSGDWRFVEDEIRTLAELASTRSALLKVIFETCLLDEGEIVKACRASMNAGADFVKTSTGFGGGGATAEAVRLMVETTRGKCQVKASGGIRDRAAAVEMLDLGATRLGTSSGVAILAGETGGCDY